nr:ferritin-like domain-containing protein [Nitrosomonas sp.]
MKGNTKIIATLNTLLAEELTAIDQYFAHSRMYEDWGLTK